MASRTKPVRRTRSDLNKRYVEALELTALCGVFELIDHLGLETDQYKTLKEEIKDRTRHLTVYGKAGYREDRPWSFDQKGPGHGHQKQPR